MVRVQALIALAKTVAENLDKIIFDQKTIQNIYSKCRVETEVEFNF